MKRSRSGFTLVEILIALSVFAVAVLLGAGVWNGVIKGLDGRTASDALREVALYRTKFLADHRGDGLLPADLTGTRLTEFIAYLPGGVWPSLPKVSGTALSFDVTGDYPVLRQGSTLYDPTGAGDGLWEYSP